MFAQKGKFSALAKIKTFAVVALCVLGSSGFVLWSSSNVSGSALEGSQDTFNYPLSKVLPGCKLAQSGDSDTEKKRALIKACGNELVLFHRLYCEERAAVKIEDDELLSRFLHAGAVMDEETLMWTALSQAFQECIP